MITFEIPEEGNNPSHVKFWFKRDFNSVLLLVNNTAILRFVNDGRIVRTFFNNNKSVPFEKETNFNGIDGQYKIKLG